ncbi:hypothetical protein G6L91_11465 [Agrobacterium rhizogenes]|uniref:hypothetical protein n=1 Tax=Rhizobium rhizogenes TaxID=359 RepID=UPI001573EAD2|nr:hypothetical protein [Rhizobium rhizogenes]NTF62085.1 hypothetical protein [Rhizobium rhizogenes]
MSRANYFAIDRRSWNAACLLGLNEAVAYLVIGAGTGADQRTSSWSATAVEKYTGMHHRRAAAAIARLCVAKLLTVEKRGKLRRYFLQPPLEVPSIVERAITLAKGKKDREQAFLLPLENPEWIWLPNSLVEGATDETPPLKLLRQAQHLRALWLFIELYYHHDLAGSGGVEWRNGIGIREQYERREVAQHGIHKVWAFTQGNLTVWKAAPFAFDDFWETFKIIKDAGLVEFVPHLVESDLPEAEIIHPLAFLSGEPGEIEIGIAAVEAGRHMAPYFDDDRTLIVPVSKLRPNVQLVGVVRMKYRPQTARTAQWLSNADEWKKTAMAFEELARSVSGSGIKVVSR